VLSSVDRAVADRRSTSWREAITAFFDSYVDAFRSEPGFASLRAGDVLDLRPATGTSTVNSHIAEVLLRALAERFGIEVSAKAKFGLENAIVIQDALVARAFARSPRGEAAFLESGRSLVLSTLAPLFD
jgi:ABC-type tungstate transport system permease subunit